MAPSTSLALVGTAVGVAEVKEVATPDIAATQILIQTHAVALNPTDWKHKAGLLRINDGLGCDFAGVVDAVGADVTSVKVGDRVAGFVHGGRKPSVGSFAQYIQTEGSLVWKVPQNIAYEEAAALGGIGPHTAFQALYLRLAIPHPSTPAASPSQNFDLVKSLGATDAYDYSDASNPAKIKAKYPTLALGFDCIAEKGSTAFLAQSLGSNGGKIVTLLPVQPENQGGVANVVVESTLVYTVLGKDFDFPGWKSFPADPQDKADMEKWLLYVPSIIGSGQLKSNPLLHQSDGLEAINDGLELLKSGKTSAQKIVYTIV